MVKVFSSSDWIFFGLLFYTQYRTTKAEPLDQKSLKKINNWNMMEKEAPTGGYWEIEF